MINIYFSDTEAVEACICRLNVMWCDDCMGEALNCFWPTRRKR